MTLPDKVAQCKNCSTYWLLTQELCIELKYSRTIQDRCLSAQELFKTKFVNAGTVQDKCLSTQELFMTKFINGRTVQDKVYQQELFRTLVN